MGRNSGVAVLEGRIEGPVVGVAVRVKDCG